jgi:copper(I)-binding protein
MSVHHIPTRLRRAHVAVAISLLALGATACGDDSSESSSTVAETVAIGDAAPATDVVVEGQWARTSPSDAANGAAYFTITSADADKLMSISVDASVASMAQLHETVMKGSSDTAMGSATTMAGTGEMTMQPVDFIELKAGTPVELKPGGYHVMMMGLASPLKVGDTIKLTLTLEKAGDITIDVPVLDEAP